MACKWGKKRGKYWKMQENINLLFSFNKLSYIFFVESKPGGKNPTSGYLHILHMKTWSDKIQCPLAHVILNTGNLSNLFHFLLRLPLSD